MTPNRTQPPVPRLLRRAAATRPLPARGRARIAPARRAFTFLEILVALLVALALLTSVVATFITILNLTAKSDAHLVAVANARAALETISMEIKGAALPFLGLNNPEGLFLGGDGVDNDGDELVDEEQPDGRNDDDGDWADQHAGIGAWAERPDGLGVDDLGDFGVDEDCVFNLDELAFRVAPSSGPDYDVLYRVAEFQGRERVLVRLIDNLSTSPLAYDVLSFNCLYWNPAAAAPAERWAESWSPSLNLPACVAVEITVHADAKPIESYTNGQPVRTVTERSIINIESMIP
jgi:type II secretory pathway pseudopilin PulG